MKRPSVVKVLGFLISINWSKEKCDKHQLEHGEKIQGYFWFSDLEIVVNGEMPLMVQQEVLLHELLHAVFYFTNCAIDNPDEEQYVTLGTPVLMSVLKDPLNKDVFEFIFGDICSVK